MKLAIVGSRGVKSADIGSIVAEHGLHPTTVISGGALGIDKLAERWAKDNGIPTEIYLPDYKRHLQGAPIRRNELMARDCDILLAIWDGKSKGTAHIVKYAQKLGKSVIVVKLP